MPNIHDRSRRDPGDGPGLAGSILTFTALTSAFLVTVWTVGATLLQEAEAIEHAGEVAVWIGGGVIMLFFALVFGAALCSMGAGIVGRLHLRSVREPVPHRWGRRT